jgi:acyl-CoA thioesterase
MNREALCNFFENDRYAALTGAEIVDVNPGFCRCKLEISEKHLNAANVIQGGAIFTLADFAFAVASNSRGQLALAVQVSISFISSRSAGTLYAEAREISEPKRLGLYEVRVTDQDDVLVALFNGTVYRKSEPLSFGE